MIAALYVAKGGCYYGLPDVDPWDEERDARLYAGPHPVVAHPPCARWSVLWHAMRQPGDPRRPTLGDDGGMFAAALAAVRNYGGVLEHPAQSAAWPWHGLNKPPAGGGWVNADWWGGWTCCVAQRNYGHRARKRTWLYAAGVDIPAIVWGDGPETTVGVTNNHRDHRPNSKVVEKMSKRERAATPIPFRDLLLDMARSARP